MPTLTIRHITTYRYRQPVAFGEHRMMLRPRDSHDQSLIDARLLITPTPANMLGCSEKSPRQARAVRLGVDHPSQPEGDRTRRCADRAAASIGRRAPG
jgi:hypothetical protein